MESCRQGRASNADNVLHRLMLPRALVQGSSSRRAVNRTSGVCGFAATSCASCETHIDPVVELREFRRYGLEGRSDVL